MIKITDWMSTKILTIDKDKEVFDAVKLMTDHNVGAVIVIDKSKTPVGMLTERDILFKIVKTGLNPRKVMVADIMTKKIIMADKERTIMEICKIMYKSGMRRMPITQDGKIVGIITSMDIIHLMSI